MHLPRRFAVLALAATLGLASCKTAPSDPQYHSHWNIGSLGPRAQYVFTGYDPLSGQSLWEHEAEEVEGIALTFRRHFLNDNPHNPLQMRRGWGNHDNPYNPTSAYYDLYYLGREGVLWGYRTAATGLLMPVDLVVGPTAAHAGFHWKTSGRYFDALSDPVSPEEFEVLNP